MANAEIRIIGTFPTQEETTATENYVVVGDIHGRADLLDALISAVIERGQIPPWRWVFLGDMVDRGPDSFKVVEKVKWLCENNDAIALRGNHEDLMLRYYDGKVVDPYHIWMYNGGKKTAQSYADAMKMYGAASFFPAFGKSGHAAWIKSLPYYYETERVWFSHAPIPVEPFRRKADFRTDVEALTWSWHGNHRVDEGGFAHDHGKLAVCGHVHALQTWDETGNDKWLLPRVYDQIIYADTGSGCSPYAPLSAIFIEDGTYKGYIQAVP